MSFTTEMQKFALLTSPADTDRKVKTMVFEIGNRLVLRSPVGNPDKWKNPKSRPAGYVGGSFRSNWQYGFNAEPSGELSTIEEASVTTKRIETGVLAASSAGIHYIVNNLPYAQEIEMGHSSTQAPSGVVGLTEAEFPEIVARVLRA